MDWWADLAAAVQGFVTSLAIIVGGFWTYRAFLRQRLGQPRLLTSVSAQAIPLQQPGQLIRCQVSLENRGGVVATSRSAEIRCRQIIPMPTEVQDAVAAGFDPIAEDCTDIEWPLLAERRWKWDRRAFEIEPGETDSLCADFFVPAGSAVLEIYFFLANARKIKQNLGWQTSTIVDLTTRGESDGQEAQQPEARAEAVATAAQRAADSAAAASDSEAAADQDRTD